IRFWLKGLGYENYNAVPPPYIGNFMPLTPDLSFTKLDEFVNDPVVDDCKAMSSEEEPKIVKKNDDALIIEEWVSDDEEEDASQPKTKKKTVRPSIVKKEPQLVGLMLIKGLILLDHVKSNLTTVEVDARSIRRIGSHQYAVSTGQTVPDGYNGLQFSESYSYGASHIDKSIPRKEKDPGSFTLPCYINNVCFDNALADLGASVNRTVKYPKGIAKNVLVEIGKFVFPVDVIILDMLENIKVPLILKRPFLSTAMLRLMFQRKLTLEVGGVRLKERLWCYNRSLGPLFGDYIEQNDLNVPVELRRDQVDDLMPTIEECEVVEEFRARNDARMVSKIFGYPSDCDHDKKIRIDCAQNLKFSCMIDFAVLEYMEAYRDEEMGDVIFG
ncbi:hypothetical protein Tco_0247213, partial [Tanacetum coccineum]